jgi:hypothetical protein
MKVPALFAPAAQECDGFRILPQHSTAFAFGLHVINDALEIDRYEFFHSPTITPIKPPGQQPAAMVLRVAHANRRSHCLSENSIHLKGRFLPLSFGKIILSLPPHRFSEEYKQYSVCEYRVLQTWDIFQQFRVENSRMFGGISIAVVDI